MGSFLSVWQLNNTKRLFDFLIKLGKKYPGICSIRIGTNDVILINDLSLLKKMLSMPEISDRDPLFLDFVADNDKTHATMNGTKWIRYKKITQSTINTYAVKNIGKLLDKCWNDNIFPDIERNYIQHNKAFYDIKSLLREAAFWVFFKLVYGADKMYELNDQKIYDKNLEWHIKRRIVPLAFISHIFGGYFYLHRYFKEYFYKYHNGYRDILKKYYDMYNNDESISKDSIQYLLYTSKMPKEQIFNEITNIIGGAIDNATNVLTCALFHLSKNIPDNIQETIYNELINVHNKHDSQQFDPKLLIYCHKLKAFVYENMRLLVPNPVGATRYCNKNIKIKYNDIEYNILKDTIIWWNVPNTVYDNKYWDSSKYPNNTIILERFLNKNGQFYERNELMTFGFGKRKCTGRLIVIKQFTQIIGQLIWKYKIKMNPKDDIKLKTVDDIRQGIGFIQCKPFGILFQKR